MSVNADGYHFKLLASCNRGGSKNLTCCCADGAPPTLGILLNAIGTAARGAASDRDRCPTLRADQEGLN